MKKELPTLCIPLVVENVLVSVSKITSMFYPDAINDHFDDSAVDINETDFKDKVIFGKNVLIGKNVSIGKNCKIGHNTIIEKNVSIGDNCSIGSNTILRNSLISNNVKILDNCPARCPPMNQKSGRSQLRVLFEILDIGLKRL